MADPKVALGRESWLTTLRRLGVIAMPGGYLLLASEFGVWLAWYIYAGALVVAVILAIGMALGRREAEVRDA